MSTYVDTLYRKRCGSYTVLVPCKRSLAQVILAVTATATGAASARRANGWGQGAEVATPAHPRALLSFCSEVR